MTQRIMGWIGHVTKGILWVFLGTLIVLNLLILLSGKFYLYKGIRHTYLIGKAGPEIYDLNVFSNDTIQADNEVFDLKHSSTYNSYKFRARDASIMEELDTRAFLVLKGDTLLFEKYYRGHDEQTVSNSFSAAKTLVAMLIAIAVEDGKIKSLDEPISNYLPAFKSGEKAKITIRHLLIMSSGLDWEESASNPLSENAESYYGWDLKGLVEGQRLVSKPGEKFIYQSGNSQLLGYVLEKATGKTVSEYTEEKIWKRIGTEGKAYWSLDRKGGDEKSFCCLYATARDFARLGLLIHRGGTWMGEQIVPSWFVKEMSIPANMGTEEGVPNYRYGLHVWLYPEKDQIITYCRGIKGQYIISIPKEDLVVVRIGMNRKDNVCIPEKRSKDKAFIKKIEKQIGHPEDLFDYLRMAREISQIN